jgi:hypothetical protein
MSKVQSESDPEFRVVGSGFIAPGFLNVDILPLKLSLFHLVIKMSPFTSFPGMIALEQFDQLRYSFKFRSAERSLPCPVDI